MPSDSSFLFIPSTALCFFLFVAVFAFWLTPGGLTWALWVPKTRAGIAIPGPSGLPVLGLALSFRNSLTHRILAGIARRRSSGSGVDFLMAFSVGFTRFIISSNPDSAKEILNSSAFSNRPVKESAHRLLFDRAMGFAPYGEYWRNLRRIASSHMFSPRRVACFGEFRRELGVKMGEEIMVRMSKDSVLEVREVLCFWSLNNVMMSVFGKWYDDFKGGGDGLELLGMVREGYELLGIFNWSDHFNFLGWMDLQGVRRRSKILVGKVNVFVGKIIEEHRMKRDQKKEDGEEKQTSHDFVDVLLDLEEEQGLADSDMIAVLWEMIFRGTDTVAILLEWILARIILHLDIQAKAQHEIDTITAGLNRSVDDSDLPKLPYLQAIVKETLRMHPPGPLLSWARLAIHDTHVGPHFVPAGTTAMVNMWAITHDEKVWPEPEKFRPERFLKEDVAIMGSDLRLAPFGSGRRVCPGKTMGLATVHLWLAQLLQRFKWIAADDSGVDLTETLKLSMEMKQPLVCKALPRTRTT